MRTARTTTKSTRSATTVRTKRTAKTTPVARKTATQSAPRKAAGTTAGRAPVRKSAGAAANSELVPLLVYIPRRVRERLNKLVRDIELANQAEAISKLVNDAYRR